MLAAFEGTSPVSGDAAEEEALPNSLAAEAEGEESDLDEDEDDDDDDDEDELDACALHGDLLEKADEDRLAEEEEEAAAGALSSAHVPPAEDEVLILPGEASIDTRSVEVLEVPMVIISAADAQGLVHVQATEVVRGPEGVQEGTMPAVPSTSPLPLPPLPAVPSPPLPVQWAPVVTLDARGGRVASDTAASSSAAPLSPELIAQKARAIAAAEGLELVPSDRSGTGFKGVARHHGKYDGSGGHRDGLCGHPPSAPREEGGLRQHRLDEQEV